VSYRAARVVLLLLVAAATGPALGLLGAGPVESARLVPPAAGLHQAQVALAAKRRAALPAGQQARLARVLTSATPAARPYLVRTFSAGHSVAEVAALAEAIAGHGRRWLAARLDPLATGRIGLLRYHGAELNQYDDTTCGSTTLVAVRLSLDPLYAFRLTTGGRPGTRGDSARGFKDRLRGEERAVHRRTASWWPEAAGTPPWGLDAETGRIAAALPVAYRWETATPGFPDRTDQVIRLSLAAAGRGYPVPMLIGDLIPRHYVLLLGRDRAGALFFEPAAGEIRRVTTARLARHDFGPLGFPNLKGALIATSPL